MNVFCVVAWNEDDVLQALDFLGECADESLVKEVIHRCVENHRLEYTQIESGWDVIYSVIREIISEREQKI